MTSSSSSTSTTRCSTTTTSSPTSAASWSRRSGSSGRPSTSTILEDLRTELGYVDYLGALQRYRLGHPHDSHVLAVSPYLIDYPFANRLYAERLDAVQHAGTIGRPVILSDGDVVFQPRKIHRSGLFEEFEGHILVYIHKEEELADVERRYPARHYVLVDDKLRILTAVKEVWGDRVTTVFPSRATTRTIHVCSRPILRRTSRSSASAPSSTSLRRRSRSDGEADAVTSPGRHRR